MEREDWDKNRRIPPQFGEWETEAYVEGKRKKRSRREAVREERVSCRVMWLGGSGGGGLRKGH